MSLFFSKSGLLSIFCAPNSLLLTDFFQIKTNYVLFLVFTKIIQNPVDDFLRLFSHCSIFFGNKKTIRWVCFSFSKKWEKNLRFDIFHHLPSIFFAFSNIKNHESRLCSFFFKKISDGSTCILIFFGFVNFFFTLLSCFFVVEKILKKISESIVIFILSFSKFYFSLYCHAFFRVWKPWWYVFLKSKKSVIRTR